MIVHFHSIASSVSRHAVLAALLEAIGANVDTGFKAANARLFKGVPAATGL